MKNPDTVYQPADHYKELFDRMNQGYILVEVLFDETDRPYDIYYIEANAAAEQMTGTQLAGKRTTELDPNYEQHWFDIFGRIAKTGVPEEHELSAEPLGVYYQFYGFKIGAPEERKIAVIYQDVTGRRKAELAAKESQSHLSAIFDVLPASIGLVDLNGKIVMANPQMEHYMPTGIIPSRDKAGKSRWRAWDENGDLIKPDNYPGSRALRGERVVPGMELLYTDESGIERWTSVTAVPLRDAEGAITGEVNVIEDIDSRKRIAEALERSEEQFRLFITASSNMVYRMSADWKQMYHLDGKNVLTDTADSTGDWTEKYIPQEDRELVWQTIRTAIENKTIFELEHRVIQADGSIGWVISRAVPILDQRGDISEWLGAGNDITERKLAESSLRESEDRLKTVLDEINEAFYVLDEELHFLFASKAALTMWGKNPEEVFGQEFLKVFPEAAGSISHKTHLRVLKTMMSERFETISPVLHRWIEAKISPRQHGGLTVAFWDIEDRKRAEEALRKSEEKYRTLFNTMDEGFAVIDLILDANGKPVDTYHVEANAAYERHTGISGIVGKRGLEVIPSIGNWLDFYGQIAKTGLAKRLEYYIEQIDRWLTCYVSRVGGEGSLRMAVVFNDITERKRNEASLAFLAEVSRELAGLSHIGETMPVLGAKIGAHFNVTRCAFAEINEEAGQASIAYDWYQTGLSSLVGEYRITDFSTDEFQLTLRRGEPFVMRDAGADPRVNAGNLAAIQVASLMAMPFIREGQVLFVLCIYDSAPHNWQQAEIELLREITARIWTRLEQAHAEDALRKSEERLQLALKGANILTWDVDPETGQTRYSDNFNEVIGFEISAISDENFSNVHPDDEKMVLQAVSSALAGKVPLDLEHRIINPQTKNEIWVKVQGRMTNRAEGKPTFIGITQNITERKLAEEVLKDYNKLLEKEVRARTDELKEQYTLQQTMLDTTLIGMSVFAPKRNEQGVITDFEIVMVNKKIESATGRSDLHGKLYSEIFPGIKEMGLFDLMVSTMETGQSGTMTYHYQHEGIDRWYSTMFVKGEDILVSTNLDVTEQKLSEQRLRQIEAEQQQEIVLVTLRTQEEERKRISESLHNGLGQTLYGVKISLSQLTIKNARLEPETFEDAANYTNELLSDAIRDTRRISHELMPAVLEEFGLKAAVADVCEQLQDGVHLECTVEIGDVRLDKYIELAVFRILQELMINVVKHAEATHAEAKITYDSDQIVIRVADNGRGIDTQQSAHHGIGLASIRSRAVLLKGEVDIASSIGNGTTVTVVLPYAGV